MLAVIGWIVFGLIAGIIAKVIMPGKDPGGFIVTTLIGIVGAVIGGYLGQLLFGYGASGSGDVTRPGFLMSLVLAVAGAIILLLLYRLLIRGRVGT
jgi:Predicted membrane protein